MVIVVYHFNDLWIAGHSGKHIFELHLSIHLLALGGRGIQELDTLQYPSKVLFSTFACALHGSGDANDAQQREHFLALAESTVIQAPRKGSRRGERGLSLHT